MMRKQLFLFVLIFLSLVSVSHAETWYVNSTTGNNDSGDGSSGQPWATIQYAIDHTEVLSGDTIDVTGTITADGTSTNYDGIQVTKNLTIQGQGAGQTFVQGHATDAASADRRCFTIDIGKVVIIKDMTLRYGKSNWIGGGAIMNNGRLTLENCVITDNTTLPSYDGGGIYNNSNSVITITNCTIKNNTSGSLAGGIYTNNNLTMENSTISGNSSNEDGGGICLKLTGVNDTTLTMVNCTISGNSAGTTHDGGGIYLWVENYNTLNAELTNVTIADNTCGGNGTGIYEYSDKPADTINLTIMNSILSNGTTNNYAQEGSGDHIIARTYTICRDNTMDATGDGNLNSTDPLLGALADNGGDTQTHALMDNSPAIDSGTPLGAPIVDQRGVLRLQGSGYDIGAYEYTPPVFYVNSSTGVDDAGRDGSITQPWATIQYAINRAEVTDNSTIDVTGTITADGTSTDYEGIQVTKDLTIQGQGADQTFVQGHATDAASADRRCFTISSGKTVTIKDMTLQHGKGLGGGAISNMGVLNLQNCVITDNSSPNTGYNGGGIFNGSLMTISNCTVKNNTCTGSKGGGIATLNNSVITNTTISNNSSNDGGGIYLQPAVEDVTLTMTNCTISGNSAGTTHDGGGICLWVENYNTLNAELTNVTIADNTCGGNGTGIYEHAGDGCVINLTITNSILNNGTSNNYGQGGTGTHNLSRTYTLCRDTSMDATGDGNLNDTDPFLDILADNGGDTQTHALSDESPAIGAGTSLGILHYTDQRGYPHIGAPDMGSYEYGSSAIGNSDNVGSDYSSDISDGATLNVNDGATDLVDLVIASGGSGSASMVVQRYLSQHPQGNNGVNFWWHIVVTGNWTGDLTLYYDNLDLNGIAESDLQLWHWNGSDWESYFGIVDVDNNFITVEDLTPADFSQFTLGDSESPLFVELAAFDAKSITNGIQLHWRTESEINNAGFNLYRDDVKLNAEMIAGQGTTTNPQSYSFLDEDVKAGETYVYQISDVEEYTLKETFHNEVEITYTPPSEDDNVVKPAPSSYDLHDCYPNPFNPITTITFDLPEPVQVNLSIYDIQGQLVRTLVDGEMNAGSHPVQWDGTNENGDAVSSGVYFYTISTDNFELNETKAMVLMK